MSLWYYAGADRQTHGPVERDALVALILASALPESTQLWQEGWPNWRPLADCRDLLGLGQSSAAPPPLPPRLPPPISPARPPAAVTPPPGMSRKAVALIVLGVGGLVAVFVIAMLAAIALPAYQQYVARSQVAQVTTEALPLRAQVDNFLDTEGHCPDNDADGFKSAEAYASPYVESIVIGEFDDDSCGLELVLTGTKKRQLDGKRLWWAREDDGHWVCSSEIEDRYLPHDCRG